MPTLSAQGSWPHQRRKTCYLTPTSRKHAMSCMGPKLGDEFAVEFRLRSFGVFFILLHRLKSHSISNIIFVVMIGIPLRHPSWSHCWNYDCLVEVTSIICCLFGFMGLRSRIRNHGSSMQSLGSRIQDQESWTRNDGSRIQDPTSGVQEPGSRMLDSVSGI